MRLCRRNIQVCIESRDCIESAILKSTNEIFLSRSLGPGNTFVFLPLTLAWQVTTNEMMTKSMRMMMLSTSWSSRTRLPMDRCLPHMVLLPLPLLPQSVFPLSWLHHQPVPCCLHPTRDEHWAGGSESRCCPTLIHQINLLGWHSIWMLMIVFINDGVVRTL